MKPMVGMVVSNKMQKSVVVVVDRLFHHKIYNRYVKRTSKFMAHDEHDQCNVGDRVNGIGRYSVGEIYCLDFLLVHKDFQLRLYGVLSNSLFGFLPSLVGN
ncbi:unnamed protein product [Ilex paraguariensis]|uniref:30S ribosomal protein S17, chloroplastic n=1 Tax=Ilex paraguariensis TaxID=185542 RepID=A0ABC8T952_9AQUA